MATKTKKQPTPQPLTLEPVRPNCVRATAEGLGVVEVISNGASLYLACPDRDADGNMGVWPLNGVDCRGSAHADIPADGEAWVIDLRHFYLSRAGSFAHNDATPAARKKCAALLVAFLTAFGASEAGAKFIREGRFLDAQEDIEQFDERLAQIDAHRKVVEAARDEAIARKAALLRGEPDPGAVERPESPRGL